MNKGNSLSSIPPLPTLHTLNLTNAHLPRSKSEAWPPRPSTHPASPARCCSRANLVFACLTRPLPRASPLPCITNPSPFSFRPLLRSTPPRHHHGPRAQGGRDRSLSESAGNAGKVGSAAAGWLQKAAAGGAGVRVVTSRSAVGQRPQPLECPTCLRAARDLPLLVRLQAAKSPAKAAAKKAAPLKKKAAAKPAAAKPKVRAANARVKEPHQPACLSCARAAAALPARRGAASTALPGRPAAPPPHRNRHHPRRRLPPRPR